MSHNQPKVITCNGGGYAQVIEHSVADGCAPLFTLEIRYPRMVHAEFMTHRVFSRNAASSRTIPILKMLKQAGASPVHWGANQAGMQANAELSGWRLWAAKGTWEVARSFAKGFSWLLYKIGAHKQIANRLTEPFQFITVVVTASEWSNFFLLRDHPAAQPEIQELARAMRLVMDRSIPYKLKKNEWHLPYVRYRERNEGVPVEHLMRMSAARCARTSYLNHNNTTPSAAEDLSLFNRLVKVDPQVMHLSPTEHQATPGDLLASNLKGWVQFRKLIEIEGS